MISPMHDLARALDIYEGELARAGRTVATRSKYRDVLEPFVQRHREKALSEITPDDCRAYLDGWTRWREPRKGTRSPRPPASAATLALYVSVLRGFFRFCSDEGWIEHNPMDRIMRPRRKRPEDLDVVGVAERDVLKLMAACEAWDDLLCIACLCYLGPRRRALARIRRSDVDLDRGTARFLEKGDKVAVKPLPDELAAIIRAGDENGVWRSPSDYLIPNRRPQKRSGERSAKVIYAIVKRVAERAKVNVHPHALRAAFAVHFHDQHPGHVTALKELLGHSRVETTYIYLRRVEKSRAMETVRDLSWGESSVFPPSDAGLAPARKAFADTDWNRTRATTQTSNEPLRAKLAELSARSRKRAKR